MRHPNQRAIPTLPRASATFERHTYVLETAAGVELSGHKTFEALLRGIEEKGDVRIRRTADNVIVWPVKSEGSESR